MMETTRILSDNQIELAIDIETYSSVNIGFGAYAYSEAPDFAVLLIGYKFSDEKEVHCIDLTQHDDRNGGDELTVAALSDSDRRFLIALTDPATIKTAYNANFERTCLAKWAGQPMPPEQWRDTMILAVQLGLPRSLEDVGAALGLPEDQQKLKTGKALIQYFCKPCRPTKSNGGRTRNMPSDDPDKWQLFITYNKQDVVTEQAILNKIGKKNRPGTKEEKLWDVDQNINDRGVLLDTDLAQKIVAYNTQHQEKLLQEAKEITGLDNPNSLAQLKPWIQDAGIRTESLTKAVVSDLLDGDLPDDVRRVLEIRQSLGKTSVKKFQAMLDIACPDGRARGIMQFYGGHTGRWAGRSLQPQNLARNTMPDAELDEARALIKAGDFDTLELLYGDPSDVFSQLVRTGFIPSQGSRFVVSDFSAIEARVIAWICGEGWRLDVFRSNGDIYCESASRIYHVPVVKHGINGELRQRGKVAELALGYGGAIGAMKSMDTTGSVPEEEMGEIVQQWRAESPHIVRFWRDIERKAISCVQGNGPQVIKLKQYDPERARLNEQATGAPEGSYSEFFDAGVAPLKLHMQVIGGTPVLRIALPYGRDISYWDPIVKDSDMGSRLTYMSQNQTTRKWERTETYGGKLTENVVQSIARDCLAEKMMSLEARGYHVVFHVHDEMIFDAPREDTAAAKVIDDAMAAPIDWAPGLPLKGGTYECDFYRKD